MLPRHSKSIWLPIATMLAATGVVLVARLLDRHGYRRPALKQAALDTLPDKYSILTGDDPTWNEMLGGNKSTYLGGDSWRYYSVFAGENPDGTKRKGGTTCGVVAAYWASKAGWPADMINRAPDDPFAPGGGFTNGAHISKIHEGARKRGWLISSPSADDVRAGDYLCMVRSGATYDGKAASGEHVDVVLDVGEPDSSGKRTITTADGGQSCGGSQCAHWNERVLTGDGMLTGVGEPARLAWIVRAPEE